MYPIGFWVMTCLAVLILAVIGRGLVLSGNKMMRGNLEIVDSQIWAWSEEHGHYPESTNVIVDSLRNAAGWLWTVNPFSGQTQHVTDGPFVFHPPRAGEIRYTFFTRTTPKPGQLITWYKLQAFDLLGQVVSEKVGPERVWPERVWTMGQSMAV